MAYKPTIDELKNTYGGSTTTRMPAKQSNKIMYQWCVTGTKAELFLQEVYTHLREKRSQAWLGLEFMQQRTVSHKHTPLTDTELALREGFYLALQNEKRPVLYL